jgi:hypothetical protein
MAKKKAPYKGYSVEEVSIMEKNCYCLVLGGDYVQEDGVYIFTKKECEKLFKVYQKNLLGLIKDGEGKDRQYALDLLPGLLISQMRVH